MVATHPGTDAMAHLCTLTRQAWFSKNPPAANPHVAYVRRKMCDVAHMPFCDALEREIETSPERQLSCWTSFKVDPELLQPRVKEVVNAILLKLGEANAAECLLHVRDNGVVVRRETQGRRRPRPKLIHKTLGRSHWCLYLRMIFLPTLMSGRRDRLPTLASKKLSTRVPWKPGRTVHVLRSRRGLHALAHHTSDETPPRNAFCWFLSGEALDDCTVRVTERNNSHPYACLEADLYVASHSDAFFWGPIAPASWP